MWDNAACGICKFKHGDKTNSLYWPDVFYTKTDVLQKATLECHKTLKVSAKQFTFVCEVACIKAVKFNKK